MSFFKFSKQHKKVTKEGMKMSEIKINNNVPNIEVTVDKTNNGYEISIIENTMVTLGSKKPKDIVKIGNREFIVLGQENGGIAVITKEFAKKMKFGKDGDYRYSDIRKYCTTDFYKELKEAVGKENIIMHNVNLEADDGTGKDIECKDYVSILTTERYRKYRDCLPGYGDWWYLATRVSHDDDLGYSRSVCCVGGYGILGWNGCDDCCGVRPFCILNPSILISEI